MLKNLEQKFIDELSDPRNILNRSKLTIIFLLNCTRINIVGCTFYTHADAQARLRVRTYR